MNISFNSPYFFNSSRVDTELTPNVLLNIVKQVGEVSRQVHDKTSPWDRLHQYFLDNSIMNAQGEWIAKGANDLPLFGDAQYQRLSQLLHTPYHISLELPSSTNPSSKKTFFTETVTLDSILSLKRKYLPVKLIGSGVNWILGKEYFKEFLLNLKVPSELLVDQLFDEMLAVPQDFDFRFTAQSLDGNRLYQATEDLFEHLANLLQKNYRRGIPITKDLIQSGCTKKWFSKSTHQDKYAMASFKFHHRQSKKEAFHADFAFEQFLSRQHLNKRDGAHLEISWDTDRSLLKCNVEVLSALPNVQEAFAHYLLRLLDAKKLRTINQMGLPVNLVSTTKGRFPLNLDFFPRLYSQFQAQHLQSPLVENLKKAAYTHGRGQEKTFLAAAFNAAFFIQPDLWTEMIAKQKTIKNRGDSTVDVILQTASRGCSFEALQSILCIHAYLGMGEGVTIYKKSGGSILEVQCQEKDSGQRLSFFIKDDLIKALECLQTAEANVFDEALAAAWFKCVSSDGLAPPDHSIEVIDRLLLVDALRMRKIAFLLLLRWHLLYPADQNIEKLLNTFTELLKESSKAELVFLASQLANTLVAAPGTYLLGIMTQLHGGIASLFSQDKPSRQHFANMLFKTGDARLCDFALKSLLKDADEGTERLTLALLEFSLKNRFPHAPALFFKFASPCGIAKTFPLFLALLEKKTEANSGLICATSDLLQFASKVERDLSYDADPLGFVKMRSLLKKISPPVSLPANPLPVEAISLQAPLPRLTKKKKSTPQKDVKASFSIASAQQKKNTPSKNSKASLDQIQKLKKQIQGGLPLLKSKELFLELAKKPNLTEPCKALMRETAALLLTKGNLANAADLQTLTNLLSTREIQVLYAESPSCLATSFIKILSNIPIEQSSLRTKICCLMAHIASQTSHPDAAFSQSVSLLVSHLQSLKDPKTSLPDEARKQLEKSIHAMMPLLLTEKAKDSLLNLLSECERLGLRTNASPLILNILQDFIDELAPKNMAELSIAESAYAFLIKGLTLQQQQNRHNPDAAAFIYACIEIRLPQRALIWAKRMTLASEALNRLLAELQTNNLWAQHAELLSYANGSLFDAQQLSDAWQAQAMAQTNNSPLIGAKTYITGHAHIARQEAALLQPHIESLVHTLITKTQPEKDLALGLMTTYAQLPSSLWDKVLQAVALTNTPAIKKAWAAFLQFHKETADAATIIKLLNAFALTNYSDPALLQYLSKTEFEQSFLCRGQADEQKAIQRLLCLNAIACVKAGTAQEIDFNTLDLQREEQTPSIPASKNLQAWLSSPHAHQKIRALDYLILQETNDIFIPIPYIPEIVQFIAEMAMEREQNDFLYQVCFRILTNEKYKLQSSDQKFVHAATKMLSYALKKISETPNDFLAKAVFSFCEVHMTFLRDIYQANDFLSFLRALPALLCAKKEAKNAQALFDKLHKKILIFTPTHQSSLPRARLEEQWEYHCVLLASLFDTNISVSAAAYVLSISFHSLEWLVCYNPPKKQANSPSQINEKRERCCQLLDRFVYTDLFSRSEGSDPLYQEQIKRIKELGALAIDNMVVESSDEVRMQMIVLLSHTFDRRLNHVSLSTHGQAAASIIEKLMGKPTFSKIDRALHTFKKASPYLYYAPKATQKCLETALKCIYSHKIYNQKMKWMSDLYGIIACLISEENHESEPFLEEAPQTQPISEKTQSVAEWKIMTPGIVELYLEAAVKLLRSPEASLKHISSVMDVAHTLVYQLAYPTKEKQRVWGNFDPQCHLRNTMLELIFLKWKKDQDDEEATTLLNGTLVTMMSTVLGSSAAVKDAIPILAAQKLLAEHLALCGIRGMYIFALTVLELSSYPFFKTRPSLHLASMHHLSQMAKMQLEEITESTGKDPQQIRHESLQKVATEELFNSLQPPNPQSQLQAITDWTTKYKEWNSEQKTRLIK